MLIEETTSILFRKDACEAPWLVLQRLNIVNIYQEDVSGLGSLNLKWSTEIVDLSKIYISNIIRIIGVLDLSA